MNALSLSLLVLVQTVRSTNGFRMFSQQALHRYGRNRAHSLSDLQVSTSPSPLTLSESPEWASSVIIKNKHHAVGLRCIDIEVQEETASLYNRAGQYVKMKKGDSKAAILSIASPPDQRKVLSFLVKESAPHEFILNTKEGDQLDLSVPQGRGFEITEYFDRYKEDFPVNNVLMVACGSGLAPITAAIESGVLGLGQSGYTSIYARRAQLYIGARSPLHLPFADKYARWEEMGIQVIPVFSRTGHAGAGGESGSSSDSSSSGSSSDSSSDSDDEATARVGMYVQEALRRDTVRTPRNTAALLCGMRGMTDTVKDILLEAGVFEGRILLNT